MTDTKHTCKFRSMVMGGAYCTRCDRRINQFCVNNGVIYPKGECPDDPNHTPAQEG